MNAIGRPLLVRKNKHHHQTAGAQKKSRDDSKAAPPSWITVRADDRDMVIDRISKELFPLLGTAESKAVVRKRLCFGVNEVAKALEKGWRNGKHCLQQLTPPRHYHERQQQQQQQQPQQRSMHPSVKGRKRKRTEPRDSVQIPQKTSPPPPPSPPPQEQAKQEPQCDVNVVRPIKNEPKQTQRQQLLLVFICKDVRPLRLVSHLQPLLVASKVPYIVMSAASRKFAEALGLKKLAAFGIMQAASPPPLLPPPPPSLPPSLLLPKPSNEQGSGGEKKDEIGGCTKGAAHLSSSSGASGDAGGVSNDGGGDGGGGSGNVAGEATAGRLSTAEADTLNARVDSLVQFLLQLSGVNVTAK